MSGNSDKIPNQTAVPPAEPTSGKDSSGADASGNFGFFHREGQASGDNVQLSPEEEAARNKRNIAIAWSLVAFMVLVFAITVMRLSQNVAGGAG